MAKRTISVALHKTTDGSTVQGPTTTVEFLGSWPDESQHTLDVNDGVDTWQVTVKLGAIQPPPA